MIDVLVVGAGAGGVIAAWRAATLGARVALFEKTPRIGTKILISGGGKCNVAHDGPLEHLLSRFRPNERLFLRPSCYRFDNRQIMKLMTDCGLALYTRPDGRVFPSSGDAKDVVTILRGYLQDAGVEVYTESPVTGFQIVEVGCPVVYVAAATNPSAPKKPPRDGFGARVLLSRTLAEAEQDAERWRGPNRVEAKAIVVATGGSSYPKSGTTGDGWQWLRSAGHRVAKPTAALAPIYMQEAAVSLAGVSARDVVLKARGTRGVTATARGDLLFTHLGISGPAALDISRAVAEHLPEPVSLEVDLFPDVKLDDLRKTITDELRSVGERVPASLTSHFGLGANSSDQKARNRLADSAKALMLGGVRTVPLERGEVVAGGVALEEVDPKSMASRLVPGLFLCGEILDLAGPVGGYNLQAAFATGYVAGESAARHALDSS